MRVIIGVAYLAILVSYCGAEDTWSWDELAKQEQEQKPAADTTDTKTLQTETRNAEPDEDVKDDQMQEVIENILLSSRQGKNLDGFDEVYSDPSVQQALQGGDDGQARNVIKDKLCTLGLMQCETVDPKRPYLSHGDLIYAHGPGPIGGPYGPPKPLPYAPRPPGFYNNKRKGYYGPPKPPGYGPPSYSGPSGPSFSGQASYSGPPGLSFSGPPGPSFPEPSGSSFPGPPGISFSEHSESGSFGSFGSSKPHGNKYDINEPESSSPYEFEHNPNRPFIHKDKHGHHEKPTVIVNAQGGSASTSGSGSATSAVQQHVHHHFHHGDNSAIKTPTVIVNNPVPITPHPIISQGIASSGGFGEIAGPFNGVSGSGFNPISSGFGNNFKELKTSVNIGSQSGLLSSGGSTNGFAVSNGVYGNGVKPVFETSGPAYIGSSSHNSYVNNNAGSNGLYSGVNSGSSASYAPGSFGGNHNFYKKELNINGPLKTNGLSSASSYNNGFSNGGYGNNGLSGSSLYSQNNYASGNYASANYQQGGQAGRGDYNNDCVCVPYDQCPSFDIIGRKDDLLLPIDPRNLGTDIEAIDDEVVVTDGNGTMTIIRVPKPNINSTTTPEENQTLKTQNDQETKTKTKREVKDDNKEKAKIEPRVLGFGHGEDGELDNKNIVPIIGVSFGLPYGSGPLNAVGQFNPLQSPIGPGGFNLGIAYVNPLLSLQLSKNDAGEKIFRPQVNFHITPNERLLGKFFAGHGFGHGHGPPPLLPPPLGAALLHQHVHHHPLPRPPPPHYFRPYPPPPFYPSPHIWRASGPPHHSSGPPHILSDPPGHSDGPPHRFSFSSHSDGPPNRPTQYVDDGDDHENGPNHPHESPDSSEYINDSEDFPGNDNHNKYSGRSDAIKKMDSDPHKYQYFNGFNNNALESHIQNSQKHKSGAAKGGRSVAFPSNRRRRDVHNDNNIESETIKPAKAEQRQAYYGQPQQQQQQQCGPRSVCCRRPNRPQIPGHSGKQCGTRNSQGINGRIKNPVYVDGDSEFGEYPWQAAILKKDPKESVYVCGGSLIDQQHIITAAHCIKTYNGFDLRVRLGEWDVNHDVEFYPYIERDVISVHVHPEYYAGTLDNDLAIMKLDRPIDWSKSPHISPACLPDKYSDFSGSRCWTTGWGKDAFGDFGKYQNILKEVDVPVISDRQCQSQLRQTRLGYSYNLHPGFVCAGGEEGKDACKGDGGGPMVCERGGSWQLVGVVSWGIGCGQVNVPGVYVKVSYYLDWIQQITGRYN